MAAAARGLKPVGVVSYTDLGNSWFAGWVAAGFGARLFGPQAPAAVWNEVRFDGDRPVTRAEMAMVLFNLRNER